MRMLRDVGSESAETICSLKLTPYDDGAALSQLRGQHPEEKTLRQILGATRFQYYFCWVLAPTKCPNVYWGQICTGEDFFRHLAGERYLGRDVTRGC